MLDKKEKSLLAYLISVCKSKQVSLVNSEDIAVELSKKHIISLGNISEIMLSLSKEGYIDYVPTESKKGSGYCVSLKAKALTFYADEKKEKKHIYFILARTVGLAVLSFVIGVVLRAIFKS